MKIAVLWTGGKDSSLAYFKVMKQHETKIFVNFIWRKPSFSHPRIITKLQSDALKKPFLWSQLSASYSESYREVITKLKKVYGVEAVVASDISNVDDFHGKLIDDVCKDVGVEVIKPLWGLNCLKILEELIDNDFSIMFTSVKEPLPHRWLGRFLNRQTIEELQELNQTSNLALCGEFGEYHTMTLDAPFFVKKIDIRLFKKIRIQNGYAIEPLQLSVVPKPVTPLDPQF